MILNDKADAAVYFGGEILSGVLSVSVSESSNTVKLYEMLSAEPWQTVCGSKKSTIKISLYGDCRRFESGDDIVIVSDSDRLEYEDAVLESAAYTVTADGKPVTEVVFSCIERSGDDGRSG